MRDWPSLPAEQLELDALAAAQIERHRAVPGGAFEFGAGEIARQEQHLVAFEVGQSYGRRFAHGHPRCLGRRLVGVLAGINRGGRCGGSRASERGPQEPHQ